MIILGIDPGTAITGYGVLEKHDKKWSLPRCLEYGCIRTGRTLSQEKRLQRIYLEMNKILSKHKPDAVSIEKVFFFKNLKTAMPVSEARGVILLAATHKKIQIFQYTPLQIKSSVVGYGNAGKQQMQRMIRVILKLEAIPKPDDAADALGAALCHIYAIRGQPR